MDAMEMSLDDIISKTRKAKPKKQFGAKQNVPNKMLARLGRSASSRPGGAPPSRVIDARLKIIEKKRANISDVRDRINSKKPDARMKIIGNQMKAWAEYRPPPRAKKSHYEDYDEDYDLPKSYSSKYERSPQKSPQKIPQKGYIGAPRGYVDYDRIVDPEPMESRVPSVNSLDRLIANYVEPTTSRSRNFDMDGDIFDLYNGPVMRLERPSVPQQVVPSSLRRYVPNDSSHLSYSMRSRLERNPEPVQSMGIFANSGHSPTKTPQPSSGHSQSSSNSSSKGFRVIVTNLHSEVSVWDIKELFADIGGLVSAEIIRPGVAEVVYKTLKDAEDAVEVYHHRQLDGMPMKCLLINPTSPSASSQRAPTSGRLQQQSSSNSRSNPMELDLDTLHHVLFKRN